MPLGQTTLARSGDCPKTCLLSDVRAAVSSPFVWYGGGNQPRRSHRHDEACQEVPSPPNRGAAAGRDRADPLPVLGAFARIELVLRVVHPRGPTGPRCHGGAGPHRVVRTPLETRPRSPGEPRGHDAERGHAGWASDSADAPSRPQSVGAGGRAARLRVRLAPRPAGSPRHSGIVTSRSC